MYKTTNTKGLSYSEMTEKTRDFYDNYCRDGLLIPMEQVVKRHSKIKSWSVEMGCEVTANVNGIMTGTWVNVESVIDKTKYIILQFEKIHNNKYNYLKVNYKKARGKVIIICPDHGEFKQTPDKHLQGKGCPKCGGTLVSNTEDFIEKAVKLHEDKYDYSKVNYTNNDSEVTIICPDHGEFIQIPRNHLIGRGCIKCGGTNRLTTSEFIEKSMEIHGDKYDYSKVKYINSKAKTTIICPDHGEFKQTPYGHLYNNQGCPKCNLSKGESIINKYFTENNINFEVQYRFDNCRNKKPLPFDFYLPDHNLCIEYDGRQHFESIDIWGGKKDLKKRQKHDQIKNNYCKENGINLLRIPYYDKHQIPEILDDYLSNISRIFLIFVFLNIKH